MHLIASWILRSCAALVIAAVTVETVEAAAPPPRGDWFDQAVLTKARQLAVDIERDRATLARCRADRAGCPEAARKFLTAIEAGEGRSGRALIGSINRAVNLAIRPVADPLQHGVEDQWSAPIDTFASGRGDCEDYAIAKHVALTELGMAAQDLRLLIVRDARTHRDHALLAVRHEQRWLLLDNRHFALVDADTAQGFVVLLALEVEPAAAVADVVGLRPLVGRTGRAAAAD
jgi:predicted transglutaminase-like cysteine proteinase